MKQGYFAVIDSGVGGVSLLAKLVKELPLERFIYYGDNDNAPYGSRSNSNLLQITMDNFSKLRKYPIKAVALGCNTISTTILKELKYYNPDIEIFGVFPPVEINLIHNRKTLLVCTPKTAQSFKPQKNLDVLIMPNLAKDIERNIYTLSAVKLEKHFYEATSSFGNGFSCNLNHDTSRCFLTTDKSLLTTEKLRTVFDYKIPYYQAVILGCTHYNFIEEQFFNHFRPQILTGGEIFAIRKIFKTFNNSKSLAKHKENNVLFIGKNAGINEFAFELLMKK